MPTQKVAAGRASAWRRLRRELIQRGLTEREADVLGAKTGWADGARRTYTEIARDRGFSKVFGFWTVRDAVFKLRISHGLRPLPPDIASVLAAVAPRTWLDGRAGLDLPLTQVSLPRGIRRQALQDRFRTIGDIRSCTDAELLSLPHINERALAVLRRWAAQPSVVAWKPASPWKPPRRQAHARRARPPSSGIHLSTGAGTS